MIISGDLCGRVLLKVPRRVIRGSCVSKCKGAFWRDASSESSIFDRFKVLWKLCLQYALEGCFERELDIR